MTAPMTAEEYRNLVEPTVVTPSGAPFRIKKIAPGELLMDGILTLPDIDEASKLKGKSVNELGPIELAKVQLVATAILVRGVTSMKLVDKKRSDCAPDEISARYGEGLADADREFLITEIAKISGVETVDTDSVLAPAGEPDESFRDASSETGVVEEQG